MLTIMKYSLLSLVPLLAFIVPVAGADDGTKALKDALAKRIPNVEITRVDTTPIKGLYQVTVGSDVVYMTGDARYMLQGDLVDLQTRTNHTEEAKSGMRLSKINAFGETNMLIYTPKEVKHTITVVTDINCPYCRRLHAEMPEYMASGIRVRYIFMPLKGRDDYRTTVSVWCAEDRNRALDLAKGGDVIENKTCDNPIDEHIKLANDLGVRGTPAIILSDGSMLPGYIPASKLASQLDMLNLSAAQY